MGRAQDLQCFSLSARSLPFSLCFHVPVTEHFRSLGQMHVPDQMIQQPVTIPAGVGGEEIMLPSSSPTLEKGRKQTSAISAQSDGYLSNFSQIGQIFQKYQLDRSTSVILAKTEKSVSIFLH